LFHSGNPAGLSCKKATGAAKDMKATFGEKLDVRVCALDPEEARPYAHECRGSTHLRLDDDWVPLHVALAGRKTEEFLSRRL